MQMALHNSKHSLALWLLAAVLAGAAAALLPLPISVALFAAVGALILGLIDPKLAVLAMLGLAPLKALIDTESQIRLPLDLGQLALFFAFVAFALNRVALGGKLGLRFTWVLPPVLIFFFAAAPSLWVAESASASFTELLKWAEVAGLVLLLAALAPHGATWLAAGLLVSGCAQALIGIYQFRGGSGAPHLWILDFRYFRAFGSFGQPNPFGAFMGLNLPLALGAAYGCLWAAWQAYRAKQKQWRQQLGLALLALLATALIGAGLVVSWSRGAWLGFGAAFVMLILFAPKKRWQGLTLVLLAIIAGYLLLASGLAPASLVARITDFASDFSVSDVRGVAISDANYAVVERLAHWQAAIGMMNEKPWFGVGFGNYETAYPRFALVNWPMALGHAHNYYLNLLAETGVIGFSGYLLMWAMIFALSVRALGQNSGLRRGLALGLLGTWSHLMVHSVFDKLYVNNLYLHIGAMLGLIAILLNTTTPKEQYLAQSAYGEPATPYDHQQRQ
jgi:putative inorganic carbon (hco3(-)) transporter